MYETLLRIHSVLRWAVLILLLAAVYKNFADRKKPFTALHRKLGLFTMIAADIQLLIGIYQWIVGPRGLKMMQSMSMKEIMRDSVSRFYAIEHITGMLIAIILVHVGYAYSKKKVTDPQKHKRILLFFGLALLIIFISIPWPFRNAGAGKSWLF
jgi:hypothetical protein